MGPQNRRSQRALEKIGAVLTGLKREDHGVDLPVYEVKCRKLEKRVTGKAADQ